MGNTAEAPRALGQQRAFWETELIKDTDNTAIHRGVIYDEEYYPDCYIDLGDQVEGWSGPEILHKDLVKTNCEVRVKIAESCSPLIVQCPAHDERLIVDVVRDIEGQYVSITGYHKESSDGVCPIEIARLREELESMKRKRKATNSTNQLLQRSA